MNISFVKWVTIARAAELIGLKICDLELRIRKHWENGTHWRRTERGVEVNLLEADRWVEQSTYTREKRNHRNVKRAVGAQSVILQSASDIPRGCVVSIDLFRTNSAPDVTRFCDKLS